MKIILAKNLGFCSGVKRAIKITEDSLKKDPRPIYFLGSLVHNEEVVNRFKKGGVKFTNTLTGPKSGTLIIQAHGRPPLPKRINKGLLIRDATCPLVKRVQVIANSLNSQGYQVVIVGDKDHSETKGIKGYTQNRALIIKDKNQVKKLAKFKKIGLVAQTTQSSESFQEIIKVLKRKGRKVKSFNTICPEVITRQKEVDEIIKKSQAVLVIGSRSSANTKRLVEKVKKAKKRVHWVNSLKEIKEQKIDPLLSLRIVSGTSTPDWEIKKITKWLKKLK